MACIPSDEHTVMHRKLGGDTLSGGIQSPPVNSVGRVERIGVKGLLCLSSSGDILSLSTLPVWIAHVGVSNLHVNSDSLGFSRYEQARAIVGVDEALVPDIRETSVWDHV